MALQESDSCRLPEALHSDPAVKDMKEKITDFRKRLYDLLLEMWEQLENKPVFEIKTAIMQPPSPEVEGVLESFLPSISNATSACDILSTPCVTDFITYGLLELLIRKLCTWELKEKMEKYSKDFGEFASGAKMNIFIQAWGGIQGSSHETKTSVLCSRQGKSWWQYTLQDARELHQTFSSESLLEPVIKSFLRFKHATDNCVTIQWLIPSELVSVLKTELEKMERVPSFRRLEILDLTLDGKCIYEGKLLTTMILSRRELSALLSDLNSLCNKWKTIGTHLHVPLGELDNIQGKSMNDNDRLKQMLEYWIKHDRNPTWFVLLDVLRKRVIGEEELSNSLQIKYCLDPVEPPIEPELQTVIHTLEVDFYALLQVLWLMQSEPGVLKNLKISIGVAGDSESEMVLALPDIAAADSVDKVLSDLYMHCDFLNCGLLQLICKQIRNQEFQQRMDSYMKELEKLKTCTLKVFMKVWRGIRRAPCNTSTLVSKQNKNWYDYTIKDAVCVKELICEKTSAPSQLIRLESIQVSDLVSVVWLMPRSIAKSLKQSMSDKHEDKDFQQLEIEQLIIDGDLVYKTVADQISYEAVGDGDVIKQGLKLMLKDHQYSNDQCESHIQCNFSYAWTPFTESPSPDVMDRWIELSESDVGFKHIRLENVSDNLKTRIEAAEGSNAVALIVINDKDNHTLSPELVQCASKGSFPVAIITCQDGKKVKERIVEHGSKHMTAKLQTTTEGPAPICSEEVVLQNPLNEELKKLLTHTAEDSDATPFEHVMTLLDAYEEQGANTTEGSKALEWVLEEIHKPSKLLADLPVYIGILGHVVLNVGKYGNKELEFIRVCGRKIDKFLTEPSELSKVITDFLVRSDPPNIKRLKNACYAVLKVRCDGPEIQRAKMEKEDFKSWFIPATILWTTLTLRFHFELTEFEALCDDTLWRQFLLRDPQLLSLDNNAVDSIAHGLTLGQKLGIPTEASLMSHVTVLLAPEDEIRQFTQMRYAIQKLSPFIATQQSFEEVLKAIYTIHCNWLPLHRDRYIGRTSKGAISGTILEGLEFLDAVLKAWKWRSGIDQICHEWLKLLLGLLKLAEQTTPQLLYDIFHSRTEIVVKYRPFIVDQIRQRMDPKNLQMIYFYAIYKDVRGELSTTLLENYLEDYKLQKWDTISNQLQTLNDFFSLVVECLPSKGHDYLLSFILKFRENYIRHEAPVQFVLDLLKIDVQGSFEDSDVTTFKQELYKFLKHKHQSQELLQEILANLPQSGKNCYFQEHIVWKALIKELVPSVEDLRGGDSCRAKEILKLVLKTVCDEPVQLSKQQEFCWAVVAYCCGLVSDEVKCEEFGWLTTYKTYKYTVGMIRDIHDKFASLPSCPLTLSELPSYGIYMQCVKEVQSIPKHWNQKLKLNDVTYDEILLYLENFEVVFHIANNFNVTDFADQQAAEHSKEEFNIQFRLLSSYLVPCLETHPVPMWCLLLEVLLEHHVNPPCELFAKVYELVLLPHPKECTLPWKSPEQFEPTTNSLDSIPLLEKCGVQLTVSRNLTLKVMISLVEELKWFVGEAIGHLCILVGSCRSLLLKEYIRLEMPKKSHSTPTMILLNEALTVTNSLVTKIVNGTATIAEVTANKMITLAELNLDLEFNILAACVGCERPQSKPNTLRRMLELFQLSSYIGSIEPVCKRYGLDGCSSDPTLRDLFKIAKDSRCDSLTLNDFDDKYKQACTYLYLNDDQSIKCLKVFKRVRESVDFYKFVEKKLFIGEQRGIPSPKQIYKFLKLCDFISELHQGNQFAQHILGYVKVAFHYILPFMNKEQTFQVLMSAVTKLNAASDFAELTTVTAFMDHIRGFFSIMHDAWQSVSAQLRCILNSGTYSFRTHPEEYTLQPKVTLEFSTEEKRHSWNSDQIVDFVHRLGLVDTKTGGELEIQCFMALNEIVYGLLEINTELRQLGHSDPNEVTPSVCCSITEEEARGLYSKAENALRTWREEVERQCQNHKWLLFFTPVKILEVYKAIQTEESSRVTQEISFLFQNTTSTWSTLDKAVKDTLRPLEQLQKCSPIKLVGKFLTRLFASQVVDVSSMALPKRIDQHSECGAFVHIGTGYNQNQLVRLILKIFHGVPASYSILSCCFSTNEEDLKLFMKRTQTFPGHYLILKVNQLSYRLQEVLLELYLQGAKQFESRVDFIETSHSLFHEVPWIGTHTIHQDDGLSFSFEEAKACFQNSSEPKPFSKVELVYGSPGVGKTHYIRQRLQNIEDNHKVTIAVNEAFQRSVAIKKLNFLQPKSRDCAVFFNFTLAPPTGQIEDSKMESYSELMDDIGWFLFELLVLGYVYDTATARSFHIPAGCGWVAYVEVPSWMRLNELVENKVPALGLVGTPHQIEPSALYCVDDDVQLLCSYFKAYESGEINTLVFEGLPVATEIHDLHPGLTDEVLLRRLNMWGVPPEGDPPVRNLILKLYKAGLLKKLCIKGSKVTFKHSHLAEDECRKLLDAYMPDCVKSNKIAQKLFVKYMKQRCDFLETFPGFCFNTGVGERKVNTGGTEKRTGYTNTIFLGSTLFETMLKEVEDFCDPSLREDWSHRPHQQLIYDMKNYSGSIGIICFKPHELPASSRVAFTRIGVEIPKESDMKTRMKLDEYLSRALNIQLDNGRLKLIDEDNYVLTLDYTLKMLNIHERFKCGVPVIIEGETGVGKTKLVEMLSKLWNQSFSEGLSRKKDHISEQMKVAVKQDGNYAEFEDAILRIATVTLELQPAFGQLNSVDTSGLITEMKCINDIPTHKKAFYSVLKPELKKLRLSPIMHFLRAKNTSEVQGNTKPLDYIRHEHLESLFIEAEDEEDILATSLLFHFLMRRVEFPSLFHKLFIDATLKPVDVRKFFLRVSTQATQLKDAYEKSQGHNDQQAQPNEEHLVSVPNVTAYLDEVNTSSCLGLFKEIIVDRTIDGEPIPDNIFIIASCNPHRGNSLEARGAKTHYYVRQLHPTLHFLKWDYGSLNQLQEEEYIKEKLVLLKKSEQHMVQSMSDNQAACLTKLISWNQVEMRDYATEELRKNLADEEAARLCAKSCVSQRDIQRVFTLFEWLLQMYEYSRLESSSPDECWYRAVLVATGIVYYLRLNLYNRRKYKQRLDILTKCYRSPITFSEAFRNEIDWMIESVDLPKGIAKTLALKENLFAVIVCCVTKTPLIIEGAPGCSKTLSFQVAVSNLKGKVSEKPLFQHTSVFPSLAPCFYQCSRSTTSNEIRSVFHRAISRDQTNAMTSNEEISECSVVFMDEAGLPEEELKVLHHFLDTPEVSFVAITNSPLDVAKTNRALSVYRPETNDNDLETLAAERLSHNQERTYDIKGICNAYRRLMKMQEDQHEEFFGLRDFMYFLMHIQRYDETPGAQAILNALERNFNGKNPEQFKELSAEFLKKVEQSQQVTYHSTLTILKESLKDRVYSSEASDQFSIQSDVRFKMIIDSSEDGSLLRLLFSFKVLDRERTRVYVCSNFPGDKHLQVNTIAQIRRSAAKGETIVMFQPDRVNDSFYDFFNQRFRCIDDHDHGTLYYANVAIGAHSLLTQVDPNFQCVLVVKESEIKAGITTPALLNRFEKYHLSHESMWEEALGYLTPGMRMIMNMVCHKVMQFVDYLDPSSFYGLLPNSTVYSVMISMVELPGRRRAQGCTITRLTTSKEALILHSLLEFVQKKSKLRIPEVLDGELESDAKSIFEILRDDRWFEDHFHDDFDIEDVEEAVSLLVDSEDPMKSDKFCHVKSCILISILLNWLIRQGCKRLMQIMTPEALAVQNDQIPRSYIQSYLQFQSHFSLKDLLARQCTRLQREMRTATKLLCYTRSSPIIDQKLPPEYPSTLVSPVCDIHDHIKDLVYEQPQKVMVYKITASTSLGRMEILLQQFIKSQEFEVFLLIAGLPEISQDVINHLRILLEEKCCGYTCPPFKIFVLLLHFTPVMFFNMCYNSLILEDWEHYYMDSIIHGNVRETSSSVIDVEHWFRQCCLQDVTVFKPVIDSLQQLIPEAIPVISSCIELHEVGRNTKMNALQAKEAIEALLIKKGIGKLLCEQFEKKWDQHTMVDYMQRAASYAYKHTFSLNLVDSLQTMVNSLFVDYLVCMVRRMNEGCTIDILLKEDSQPRFLDFFRGIIEGVDVIKLQDLKAHSSSHQSSPFCSSCFKFPFFGSVFQAIERFVANCRDKFEVSHPQHGIHNEMASRKEETEQHVCEVAMSNFSDYKSEGKVFIREAADLMQSDVQNILWSRYLDDFLHHRLLPEDYTGPGSVDLSLEILKKYFEPLICEPNIVRRLVSLHIHVHIHQLDGVQFISILSILTRTCGTPLIQQASKSYMGSESKHSLLKSVQPMQTPDKLINSYQCLASFAISVLFASLQRILLKETSDFITNSQEWFSSYLNMDSSSVIKEKLYNSLSEEDSAKLTLLHCTFLAMQSSQSDRFVRARQIFNLLHSTYFAGREVLMLIRRPTLREVSAICIGAQVEATPTSSKMLTDYMEGVLEYFFSINHCHNADDCKWFLELANKQFDPVSDDQQVIHVPLSLGTYKYFLSRLLFALTSDPDSREQLVSLQFVKAVRRTIGNTLIANSQDTALGPYVPPLYQLPQIQQKFDVPLTTPVLQQQLAHLYFLVWFEQLQNVKPANLELNMLASKGSKINETLSASYLETSERSLLLIEKEVVTQAILLKLAEDTNGISKVLTLDTLKAFLNDSSLAAANGLMLATEVMKKIGLNAMKELLGNQHHPLNSELSCLKPVRSFITDSDLDADHLFRDLNILSLSLPDEKNLMEFLQANNSHTEVSVLSKFACDYSQLQSGGSLLPKLLKIYQFLHRDLAYTLSQEEVEDMTLLQLEDDLYPGVVHFDPREHNEYVQTVMGDSTYSLLDETKVKQLLSVDNDSGYLLDVIKHIVAHQNQFLMDMEPLIADQQLQNFIPEFSEIHLSRVDEHTCLTGGRKSIEGAVSEYLLTIQRRWKVAKLPCIIGYDTDLLALQRDVAVRFLSGKCKISNPDEIHTSFKFRETGLRKQDFYFPTDMEELDQETVKNNLPPAFQEPLGHLQLQKLKFEFHSSDFHKILEVETGLKICAYLFTQYLQNPEQMKMSTLSQFLHDIYPNISLRSCFEEARIKSLSETQLTTLGEVKLPNLYAVLVQFIEWYKDGFHEFHKLPLLLKEEMREEDSAIVRRFCLTTATSSRMAHFEKDVLMSIQPDLEGQVKCVTSISQDSITTYLKAKHLLDPRKEDDKWLLTSLPEEIHVQHYVHLRILIRQHLHSFKQPLFEGEQSRWKEGVMELWQSDPFLKHLSENSYEPTGEFTVEPQSSIPYGFMDQQPVDELGDESSISDSSVVVPEPVPTSAVVPTVQEGATKQLDEKQMADKCDVDGVVQFLQGIKCSQYIQNFQNQDIDGSTLHTILAGDKADNTLEGWLGVNNPIHVARIKTKFPKYLHTNFSV